MTIGMLDQNLRGDQTSDAAVARPAALLWTGILLSIHLQSNRPENFVRFLDGLEQTAHDPSSIEVIVKIDDIDAAMNKLLPEEVARRRLRLKYISTPLPEGFFGLWRSMDEMFRIADSSAYFVLNLNDEMSFATKDWDRVLRRYVGLFPDHIFRLRTSVHRSRNYYDFWEAGFANDTSAIMTRRWLEIGGGWCPCNGPDTFQECVAFYFGYHRRFGNKPEYRDVAIHDIEVRGHGASHGLSDVQRLERARKEIRPWYILMSHAMQQEASRRSQLLQAHIWAFANGIEEFDLVDDRRARKINLIDRCTGKVCNRFAYGLSHVRIGTTNWLRSFHRPYYGGGGEHIYNRADRTKSLLLPVWSLIVKCSPLQWEFVRPYHNVYIQARLGNPLGSIDRPTPLQKAIFRTTLRVRGVKQGVDAAVREAHRRQF